MRDLTNTVEFFATMKRVCAIRSECTGCPFKDICSVSGDIPAIGTDITEEMLADIAKRTEIIPEMTDEDKAFLWSIDEPLELSINRIAPDKLALSEYALTIAYLDPEMFGFLPVGATKKIRELQEWLDT